MDKLSAERIINALECGVVPTDDLDFFTIGREKENTIIADLLEATKKNESKIFFIHGDYGVGKTHTLEVSKSNATKKKLIVSHVTLSSRESPLSDMIWVYTRIIKNISFAGSSSSSPLISFLDLWLNFVNEKVMIHKGKRCKHNLTYETCGFGCIRDLYLKYMPELNDAHRDFRNALLLYQYGFLRNDLKLKELTVRWLLGEKIKKTEYKWINNKVKDLTLIENVNEDSSFDMFKSISKISKILGFNGFLILLDEAERIPSIRNVDDGYINLIKLIIKSFEMPGVCIIYATTPQFYEDAKKHFNYFKNEETEKLLEGIYNLMERERLTLSILNPGQLRLLTQRIINLYIVSEGLENNCDTNSIWQELETLIWPMCQNTNTMRDFITNILPIIKKTVCQTNY